MDGSGSCWEYGSVVSVLAMLHVKVKGGVCVVDGPDGGPTKEGEQGGLPKRYFLWSEISFSHHPLS